nr:hypothetical protein [Archangium lipolyticum]
MGTAALIQDGPLGLPMDAIYGAELARLRAEGRRMLEVGALCMGPEYRRTGLVYLFYKLMLHFGREQLMMDDAVCAVHPDAEDVYCAALGFERMGPIRQYPGLKKQAVAVALRLNMREVSERFFRRFARWPRTVKNPRWFFEEATFPQLRLPKDALFMERRLLAVLRAAGRLGEAHPESFANLSPAHESYLWRTVPTLRRILAKSRPDLCVAANM